MKTGDRVKLSDEEGIFTVIRKISTDEVLVATVEGLEFPVSADRLIVISGENEALYRKGTSVKKGQQRNRKSSGRAKSRTGGVREVDLHMRYEALNSDYHAVELQLMRFRSVMDQAIRNKEREVIFIHGVGSGRLKELIHRTITENYPGCSFHDASYRKYGVGGATHVLIGRFK